MDHIAIMKKSWRLTEKILSGEKTIESRWYVSRVSPWGRIRCGETVYIKDSGSPVTAKAIVDKVFQFSELTPDKVKAVLEDHSKGLGITPNDIPIFFDRFKDKRYCILVFLKTPQEIPPFEIDKTGFGLMSAWISTEDINRIKRHGQI